MPVVVKLTMVLSVVLPKVLNEEGAGAPEEVREQCSLGMGPNKTPTRCVTNGSQLEQEGPLCTGQSSRLNIHQQCYKVWEGAILYAQFL